jgi:hypothetical protein
VAEFTQEIQEIGVDMSTLWKRKAPAASRGHVAAAVTLRGQLRQQLGQHATQPMLKFASAIALTLLWQSVRLRGTDPMNDQTDTLDQTDEDILSDTVSDEALEAAAGTGG